LAAAPYFFSVAKRRKDAAAPLSLPHPEAMAGKLLCLVSRTKI
jgi:hypothetical protein